MLKYHFPISEPVKLKDSQQQDLVSGSNKRWTTWTDMILPISARALESKQLYLENQPDALEYNKPDDARESLSRIRRPVMAEAVDSTLAQQHLASYPSDERFFKGRPRNKLAQDKMPLYEKHVEKRLSAVDFLINTLKDRKNKMLDGASAVWHPFVYEEEYKVTYSLPKLKLGPIAVPLPGKARESKKMQRTLEATAFVPINFSDWRVDPMVDNLKEANFIWRRWIPVDELKSIEGLENTDDICGYSDAWDQAESDKRTMYDMMGITQTWEDTDSALCENALLYEEWGDFYIDGEIYYNHVLIYSNDGIFHFFGENDYNHQRKPFAVSPYIPLAGTLYGKSLAQDIIPMHHASDTLQNQEIDIISRVANPCGTYDVTDTAITEFFGDGPVSLIPGELIPVQRKDSISPLQFDLSTLEVVETALQRLKEEIRESTGGVSYATGGDPGSDPARTATEASILSNGTNTRFQLFIQMYEEYVLKPYLEMIYENDRQFITQPIFVDDEVTPIMPNMVKMMELSFDVTGSKSMMTRAQDAQNMDMVLAALPIWMQSGLVKPNGDTLEMNIPEMIKRALTLKGIRDLDNVVDVVTMQEQQQAMPNIGGIPGEPNGPQPIQATPAAGAPPNLGGPPANPGMAVA